MNFDRSTKGELVMVTEVIKLITGLPDKSINHRLTQISRILGLH